MISSKMRLVTLVLCLSSCIILSTHTLSAQSDTPSVQADPNTQQLTPTPQPTPVRTPDDETITQQEFMILIFQAKQFDTVTETNIVKNQASVDDFTTRRNYSETMNTKSILGKKRYLEHLGYCPEGGYNLDKVLTYGDFAVTLVRVLRLDEPDSDDPNDDQDIDPYEYIALLVEEDIMLAKGVYVTKPRPEDETQADNPDLSPPSSENSSPQVKIEAHKLNLDELRKVIDIEAPMPKQEVLETLERADIPVVEVTLPDYQKPLSPIE